MVAVVAMLDRVAEPVAMPQTGLAVVEQADIQDAAET
jgi:hypothetical protein